MIKSIPTIYKDINFRSRLEAKWAAFFDLLKWKWIYEPFDTEGWIPDFLIKGKDHKTLVEIKPITELDEYDGQEISIIDGYEILICGLQPFPGYAFPSVIGWLLEGYWEEKEDGKKEWTVFDYDEAALNYYKNKYGFFHTCGSWRDRVTGIYDGNCTVDPPEIEQIMRLWAEAINKVQWKKK